MKHNLTELALLSLLLVLVFFFGVWLGDTFFNTPKLCVSVADTYELYGLGGI